MRPNALSAPQSTSVLKDQRTRLLRAVTDLVADRGYLQTQVGQIASEAKVSCTTFYDLFADKEGCFLAAHAEHSAALVDEFACAVSAVGPPDATRAGLSALLAFAERTPAAFALLSHHAMLAGARALAERERLLRSLADTLESAWSEAPGSSLAQDVPTEVVLGGVIRALDMSMRRRADILDAERLWVLLDLIAAYSVPLSARHWCSVDDLLSACDPRAALEPSEPGPLPRGRHQISASTVHRLRRERLLHATAVATQANGYAGTSVADIVVAAKLSREVFYEHFANKSQAYTAMLKLFFERCVGIVAGAYFAAAGDWCERIWQSVGALLEFLGGQPSFAWAALLEPYAVDPSGLRIDEFLMGFGMFIGDRQLHDAEPEAYLRSAALIGVALEALVRGVSGGRCQQLPRLQPLIAYIVLAPALGSERALSFIQRRTAGAPPARESA